MSAVRIGASDQRAPEPDIGDEREGEIAADRQEPAMGEIDHPGQIENERQAERHQRIERADDETVEDVEEDKLCHTARYHRRPRDHATILCRRGAVTIPGHRCL